MDSKMNFSIIIPTLLCSKKELESCINSCGEVFPDSEIIVVNQSTEVNGETVQVTENCVVYDVDFRGLSKARNYGVKKSSNNIIVFVDDDMRLTSNFRTKLISNYNNNNYVAIFPRIVNFEGNKCGVVNQSTVSSILSMTKMEGYFIEGGSSFRKNIFEKYFFDENLGAGMFHGSSEGYDLVYRMLLNEETLYFDSTLLIMHPDILFDKTTKSAVSRAFYYGAGLTSFICKHKLTAKLLMSFFKVIVRLIYTAAFKRQDLSFYLARLSGYIAGCSIKTGK